MRKYKVMALVLVLIITTLCLCSCGNMQMWDTTYYFDTAQVLLPNGDVVEGRVQSWTDYEDGDQLQVKINGVTYLTHASNVVLMAGGK